MNLNFHLELQLSFFWKNIILFLLISNLFSDVAFAQANLPEVEIVDSLNDSDIEIESEPVYDENDYYSYWLDSFPVNEKTEIDTNWLYKWQNNRSFLYANDSSYFNAGTRSFDLPQISPPNWKKSISWVLIIIVILLFIYWMNKHGKFILFKPSSLKEKEIPTDSEEVNHPDLHLEKAIRESDYRSAVRYMYLILLGDLETKGYIKKRKREYGPVVTFSIKEQGPKKNFELLSRIYQYIWYGAYEISKENFDEIQALFHSFQQSLRRRI